MRQVFRECPDCHIVKPLSEFGRKTNRLADGTVKKPHKPWCKKCESKRVMATRAKRDPREIYLAQKSWAERKYGSRENDPARIASRDRERARQSEKRFLNPEIALQWAKDGTRWYRALSTHDGSIDRETLRYLRTIPECAYCGGDLGDDRHYDHITALANGGRHSADNLIPAHGSCNRRKSATPLLPFLFPSVFEAHAHG
jgi:5-methylcytosine-specific restriction endonuclease McrA